MSDSLTMDVQMMYDHYEHIPGAPTAEVGEIVTVPFTVGAKLVASGYAEPAPEDLEEDEPEDEYEEPEYEEDE
jgi:hypothetical protein